MLKPLFDKNCKLIAWIEPNEHIFDTNMNWIAYISMVTHGLQKQILGWGQLKT